MDNVALFAACEPPSAGRRREEWRLKLLPITDVTIAIADHGSSLEARQVWKKGAPLSTLPSTQRLLANVTMHDVHVH